MRVWITRDKEKYKGIYEMWNEKPQEVDLEWTGWWGEDDATAMPMSNYKAEKLLGHSLECGDIKCINIGRTK